MYPALFPFKSKAQWLIFLRDGFDLAKGETLVADRLLSKKVLPVVHGHYLADFLGVSRKLVTHMAKWPDRYYRTFQIPKKSGGSRSITAPRVYLKVVQRYLLDCILNQIPVHRCAVGFVTGRNCRDGAKQHVKRSFLWNIDLKDFFPSIRFEQVETIYLDIGFPEHAARFLARLCCLNGRLPQGAPTSPVISNLVFFELDRLLFEKAKLLKLTYTRYADDLSFSGNEPITDQFRNEVAALVQAHRFTINRRKERLIGPKARREVTGLTVNAKVTVPRKRRREIRALFHQINLKPGNFTAEKARALGLAAWIFEYHEVEGRRYLDIARSIPDSE